MSNGNIISRKAKMLGDFGENKLYLFLQNLPPYYYTLNNILLQTKYGSTQIDHVIVGPFGIFVIETKNHKGCIFGDCYGKVWTQVLTTGHYTMYSPYLQNLGHLKHLSRQLQIPLNYMQGAIVFTNEDADLSNVNCPYCFNILSLQYFILSYNVQIFTQEQVQWIGPFFLFRV